MPNHMYFERYSFEKIKDIYAGISMMRQGITKYVTSASPLNTCMGSLCRIRYQTDLILLSYAN